MFCIDVPASPGAYFLKTISFQIAVEFSTTVHFPLHRNPALDSARCSILEMNFCSTQYLKSEAPSIVHFCVVYVGNFLNIGMRNRRSWQTSLTDQNFRLLDTEMGAGLNLTFD